MAIGTTRYFLAPNVKAWNLGGTVVTDEVTSTDTGVRWIRQVAPNEGKKSAGRQLADSLGKVSSFYPIVKCGQQVCDLALKMNPHEVIGKPLQGVSSILGTTKKVLLIPRICDTILDVVQEKYAGDWLKTAKNWMEMVGSLITGWAVFGSIFGVSTQGSSQTMLALDGITDAIDLTMEGKKLSRNIQLINDLPKEISDPDEAQAMVEVAKESRNVNIFKICKLITSIAVTVLGALALVLAATMGLPALVGTPALIMLIATSVIGIASTVFGITSTFYENTRTNVLLSEPNNKPLRSSALLPAAV